MGVRERKVETYLDQRVRELGGITRKWTGHLGVPDRIVITPRGVWFVEVKTVDGALSPVQEREHARIIDAAGTDDVVRTVYGHNDVDHFIETINNA